MAEIKTILDTNEFKKYKERWQFRQAELRRRKSYYTGSVYRKSIFDQQEILGTNAYGLYKHMRPLYLPLARAVDIDAGIIPGDWAFPEDLPRLDEITTARDAAFDMSGWNTEGVLFVHYGAQYGVTGLKICDIYEGESVRLELEPLDPLTFMLIDEEVLIIETRLDDDGKQYEYAEVDSAENIRTFKNGLPFDYDEDAEVGPEWENKLGFVPVLETQHMRTGEVFGEATYQKAIPMLAELNGLASYLADIVKKHAEPQWAAFGVEPSDLTRSGDNVWFFPMQGSDAKPLVASVDVTGILEFVREISTNVKDSLPELSFDELRKKDQIATPTLELQLMELVLKVKRCRPNYDQCLADALRLMGEAADRIGVKELQILNDTELEFDQNRPILPVDEETRMKLEIQALELEQIRRASNVQEGVNA